MADYFYDNQRDYIQKLNQMYANFAAGPYNALPLTGGTMVGAIVAPAIAAVRHPLSSINTLAGEGWLKIAKIRPELQGGDIVIRVSGTASYGANPGGSNGSITTISARVDNDNRVRGSFHTESVSQSASPEAVIFGEDGSVFLLAGKYMQLSVHIDAHSLMWEPQEIVYYSATNEPPAGIAAVRAWGVRIGASPILTVDTTGVVVAADYIGQRLLPAADNAYDIGQPPVGYRTIYARTGTINTSDARLKCDFRDLTAAEIAAARELARVIGVYRWRDAVDCKGAAAREHIGPTVQRAIEIMQAHGLDPFGYGFICHDAWAQQSIEHPAVVAVPARGDYPAIEARAAYTEVTLEAGDRYAFRYDELAMFIAAGQEARLSALEAR